MGTFVCGPAQQTRLKSSFEKSKNKKSHIDNFVFKSNLLIYPENKKEPPGGVFFSYFFTLFAVRLKNE